MKPERPTSYPGPFSIGQAAKASGVSAKMIRHYESLGLLPAIKRTASNYRLYSLKDIQTLEFIKHSRQLGFPTEHIRTLLRLWQHQERASAEVKALVEEHIHSIERTMASLQTIHSTLSTLVHACQGNKEPDCPIIDTLASVTAKQ